MTQKAPRVYAIAGGGLVKIGNSIQVSNRMRALKASSPVPLELIASCVGGEREERSLHKLFDDVREHGEWFRLDEDDIIELKEILADEKELAMIVKKYYHQLPNYLQRAPDEEVATEIKPKRRGVGTYQSKPKKRSGGGSVKIGIYKNCKWCKKKFRTTNELRAWCCVEHRAKSKKLPLTRVDRTQVAPDTHHVASWESNKGA